MGTEKPRFSITVSDEMYERINEYHHENRFSTQTKAISSLIQIGLDSLHDKASTHKESVIIEDKRAKKLLEMFLALNTEGEERLLDYADDLVQSGKYKKSGAAGLGGKEKIG